jgi:PAS domain S-box-containing protein
MPPRPPETPARSDELTVLRERVAELEHRLAEATAARAAERDAQRRARDTLTFLAEASAILASSLDYEETLGHLARVAVPHIADWCAIDLVAPEGGIERITVAHVDPAKVALAHAIYRRWPPRPDDPAGVPAVIRSGKPELTAVITEAMVREGIADAELRDSFLAIGLSSLMIVPLTARGRTLGAITLAAAESGRHFAAADLRLAEDVAGRAAIAIDNAQLYRELREFRATLDRTHDCVFMFNAETLRFFYVNQGAVEQVGYSADELMAMTPLDIKPRFTEASFRAMVAPLVAGEPPLHNFETVHRHRDGHDVPVEIALQYVDPPEGDPRFVAVVRDITERKAVENELRERNRQLARLTRQLEERNRELDQFAYITSHDLKAPLRGIANLAQWIEEDLGEHATEAIRQQLELLRGRAHRMEALIEGILQYSRIGRTGETPQPVDVARLLDEVVDLLAPPPGAVTVEPAMPTIVAERVPLQQVFHNLIGNALKHGGPEVHVSVGCERRDDCFAFTVADDGPGIAPQYHDRIFGIFQTLASRDRVEGSGLGLALVKKIVEHSGGQISLRSAEGQGAAFTFTWPSATYGEPTRK